MIRVWNLGRLDVKDLIERIDECIPGSCLFDKARFIDACNEGNTLNEIIKPVKDLYESIGEHFECTAEDLYALYDRYMS